MSEFQTLAILEQIESLISDRQQVVSYKWLSRNFLVPSNVAKKLLEEFVQKHEDGLEVVYSVAGWLKQTPPIYHIRLVPGPKLAEVKHSFDDKCSVQIYSIQTCIPKDLVAIWNTEYIQAEELFKQPPTEDNCLRDNRLCGVANSFVKRNIDGARTPVASVENKSAGSKGLCIGISPNQTNSLRQSQPKNLQQPSPKPLQSFNATSAGTDVVKAVSRDLQNKEAADKKTINISDSKKKAQNDKSSSGKGGSLSNFWGRASTKSKTTNSAEEKVEAPKSNDGADAQIRALEASSEAASSDDDEPDVNFKRASNVDGGKKRRVVLDDSDDDDFQNAINLGSPDPPKGQLAKDMKPKAEVLDIEKKTLKFDEQDKPEALVKENGANHVEVNHHPKKNSPVRDIAKTVYAAASEEIRERNNAVGSCSNNKVIDNVPASPKRRKVLKTRIDERGREVTEVVWEGEDLVKKNETTGKNSSNNVKSLNNHSVKAEDNAATIPMNRPAATKKSPAVGGTVPAGKAGNKKGTNAKDPKQGNILSFFKRV